MMLFAALVGIIGGCVLLYLDFEEYGKNSPPKEKAPEVQPFGTSAKLEPPPAAPGPGPAPGPGEPMPPAPPAPMPGMP